MCFMFTFAPMLEELKNIIYKARHLFMKYGIKSITMDDIAREMGISKKTLYHHVDNKNDLLEKIFNTELEESDCYIENINRENINAIEELFTIMKFLIELMKEYSPSSIYDLRKYYPEMYFKMTNLRRDRVFARVIQNLNKGISEGLYREDINKQLIARVQVERMEKTFDNDYLTVEEIATPEIFLELFKYHIRGIATTKGIEELEKELEKLKQNTN
jgi:TetR/AcrR family transcriptional regulator, cholesterol catabolism regulator